MPKVQKTKAKGSDTATVVAPVGPLYFYEDEIFRVNKSGDIEFGMVTENWEMYSSESEESDEDNESDKVPKGHVAVTWYPSGKEGVLPESKVQLSDRSLMPGDVVRRLISGKDTQRGYARSVRVRAVVQTIGSRHVYQNVPASNLSPVQKFPPDVAVYLDSWIGSVRDMRYNLTLRFNDKSVCVVDSYTIAEYFEDTRPAAGGFTNGETFYPGQRLHGPVRYLKKADWVFITDDMKRAKDRKYVTGVVTRVECVGVSIQWQYPIPMSPMEQELLKTKETGDATAVDTKSSKSKVDGAEGEEKVATEAEKEVEQMIKPEKQIEEMTEAERNIEQMAKFEKQIAEKKEELEILEKMVEERENEVKKPADFVSGEHLKRLKCLNFFAACTVQLGDTSYYTVPANVTPVDKKTWHKEKRIHLLASALNDKLASTRLNDDDEYTSSDNEGDEIPPIVQNNAETQCNNRSDSCTTVGIAAASSKKNLPKLSTRSLRKKKLRKARQAAIFTDIASRESQVVVETIHTSSSVDVVWQDGTIEENMRSTELYPIHHLDDHEFFPGDFVVRSDVPDLNIYGVIQTMDHNGRVANVKWFEPYTTGETSPKEVKVEEVSVYDLKDHPDFRFRPGTVVFRISNFRPNQYTGGQVLDNYPDGQILVWWANNVEMHCWPQDLYRVGDYDSDEGELWDVGVEDDANSDDSWETDEEEDQEGKDGTPKENPSPPRQASVEKIVQSDTLHHPKAADIPGIPAAWLPKVITTPSVPDIASFVRAEPVPQFSMLSSVPAGHRYHGTSFQPSNSRNFLKTIQKEMSLLRNNLPDGILVKGFEDRMDLYSVMVHGPKNTPYEGGIFFFDIQLPATYPDTPPLVQYISFCQSRLNPNLYECGKVCVSLLGTWSGKGNETWTGGSSILQLLISIQSLILVPTPYYNEAGYERQRGSQQGNENARMYNEMVLIKLVQSMSRMASCPHPPWETETFLHIRSCGPQMIERYKMWLLSSEKSSLHASGVDVDASNEASSMRFDGDPGFPLFPVSKGFSITLKKTLETFEKRVSTMTLGSKSSSRIQLIESTPPRNAESESTVAPDVVPTPNLSSN